MWYSLKAICSFRAVIRTVSVLLLVLERVNCHTYRTNHNVKSECRSYSFLYRWERYFHLTLSLAVRVTVRPYLLDEISSFHSFLF